MFKLYRSMYKELFLVLLGSGNFGNTQARKLELQKTDLLANTENLSSSYLYRNFSIKPLFKGHDIYTNKSYLNY